VYKSPHEYHMGGFFLPRVWRIQSYKIGGF
jgi:hypothetical protein